MENNNNNLVTSLNPCFNGRWSASRRTIRWGRFLADVLILVLMEDGLRDHKRFIERWI